jgi:hypothetical protein
MKNISIIIPLLFQLMSCATVPAPAQFQTYNKIESQCQICGKSIYESVKVESSGFYDNMGSVWSGNSPWIADSEQVQHISWSFDWKVCSACKAKYDKRIMAGFNFYMSSWNDVMAEDNYGSKEKYQKLREQRHVQDLENQLKDVKRRLERVRQGKPETEPPSKWNGGFIWTGPTLYRGELGNK